MVNCMCTYKGVQLKPRLYLIHWNLIGCSMTAPLPMLSPSSILPPLSSHCALIPARTYSARLSKLSLLPTLYCTFFLNLHKMEPHTSTLRYVAECLNATVLVLLTLLTLPSAPHTDDVQMPQSPFELTPWRYTAHQEIRHLRTPRTVTIMFTKSCRGTP
jgi:hypothetical protein